MECSYLITFFNKETMYFHNIQGINLLEAIVAALRENSEYFGLDVNSCDEIEGTYNNLTDKEIYIYAKHHIKWMNNIMSKQNITDFDYQIFIFDITDNKHVFTPPLEAIIKTW